MSSSLGAGEPGPSVLRLKSFVLFWLARVSTTLAFQMLAVAVGWRVYAITKSALYLGLVGLAQFLPMFLLTLVAGHVADRFNRRTIVRVCQLVEAGAAVVLALGAKGWLSTDGLLALVAVVGAARAFEGPTMQALLPSLVPTELFPRAAAWSASAMQSATVVGPAVGGLLYALGAGVGFFAAGALFLAASAFITLVGPGSRAASRGPVSLRSALAGLSFIRRKPEILGAISLDLFAVLLGGATALLPAYARDILATGPWGLGLLRSAPGAGALAMSVVLARSPLNHRAGRIMLLAVAVFGLATIVFGLSTSLWLSLGALVVLGASDVVSVVIRTSLVQLRTPDEMRGRVSAVNALFIGTSNQLGEFESGLTASWLGLVPAVVAGGVGTILVVLLWARIFPDLADVDALR